VPGFEFATASRILFGEGKAADVPDLAAEFGSRVLLVSGHRGTKQNQMASQLEDKGLSVHVFNVATEPDLDLIQQGLDLAREFQCDVVIGFGGGSAIDSAKAVAALLANPGDPLDYLEMVGKNLPLRERPMPFIAVPTTAGTGSEVTRNAVINVPEKSVKVSLRSPMMLARAAVVDPELTYGLPPEITASTGMDALSQVIEPYVSRRANPLADLYCREGIRRASRSLLEAYQDGRSTQARSDMAFASLMGGLSLANAGLGAVHGFAGPIGGMFDAPHGAVCAALLPPVVEANARAMQERSPNHSALARYVEVAEWVTSKPGAHVSDLVAWLHDLRASLGIPGLRRYGVTAEHIQVLVEKSIPASSMKANPIDLTPDELASVLAQSL
jgi:alcohol dehydrogenase class IV